jgi:hypothetical protein
MPSEFIILPSRAFQESRAYDFVNICKILGLPPLMRFGLFIPNACLRTREETGTTHDFIELMYLEYQRELINKVIPHSFLGKVLFEEPKCWVPLPFDDGICCFYFRDFVKPIYATGEDAYILISKKLKSRDKIEFNWRRSNEIYLIFPEDVYSKKTYDIGKEFPVAKFFSSTADIISAVYNLEFPWLTTPWRRSRRNAIIDLSLDIFYPDGSILEGTVPLELFWEGKSFIIGKKEGNFSAGYGRTHLRKGRDLVLLFSLFTEAKRRFKFRVGWGCNESFAFPSELQFPSKTWEWLHCRTLTHFLIQFILPVERKIEPLPWKIVFEKETDDLVKVFNLRLFI